MDNKQTADVINPSSKPQEAIIPQVSPEVLLRALFTCKYTFNLKKIRKILLAFLYPKRIVSGIAVNAIGIICLLLFFFIPQYKIFNIVAASLVFIADILFLIYILSISSKLHRRLNHKTSIAYEIYFLKEFIVFQQKAGSTAVQTIIKYSQTERLTETKDFIICLLKDGSLLVLEKDSFNKHLTLDEIRGMLQENMGCDLYIASCRKDPRYEFILDHAQKRTNYRQIAAVLMIMSFVLLILPLAFNFKDGLEMNYIWMLWICSILSVLLIISSAILHDKGKTKVSYMRATIIASTIDLLLSFVLAIGGSVLNTYNVYKKTAMNISAITGIYLPDEGEVIDYDTKTANNGNLYRNEVVGKLDAASTDTEKFVAGLSDADANWLKVSLLSEEQRKLMPTSSHDNIADYVFFYSISNSTINPTYESVYLSSDMYYVAYDQDTAYMFIISYNFYNSSVLC